MIGSPESPMIGLRSLPAGGWARANCSHSVASRRCSMIPIPGTVTGVGLSRRMAWSSR